MIQTNPSPSGVTENLVVGSIKVIETPYRVAQPVFEEIIVKVPKFIEEDVKIPTGVDKMMVEMATEIADKIMANIESIITARLDAAIDQRIKEIKTPKFVEELIVTKRDIEVERPVWKDIDVNRAVIHDVQVVNSVIIDKTVVNAVIEDVAVKNAIITDVQLNNAIIKDVEVERAVIREKIVDVIHPRYLDLQGKPTV